MIGVCFVQHWAFFCSWYFLQPFLCFALCFRLPFLACFWYDFALLLLLLWDYFSSCFIRATYWAQVRFCYNKYDFSTFVFSSEFVCFSKLTVSPCWALRIVPQSILSSAISTLDWSSHLISLQLLLGLYCSNWLCLSPCCLFWFPDFHFRPPLCLVDDHLL